MKARLTPTAVKSYTTVSTAVRKAFDKQTGFLVDNLNHPSLHAKKYVNSFGGEEQQYEVLVHPAKLTGYGLSLRQVIDALSQNNINVGGAHLEHGGEQELIRGVLIQSERDIGNIVLASHQGTPVYVSSVAAIRRGAQIRQGAATRDGKAETVMGIAMMLKGENSRAVAQRVSDRLQQVQRALPDGVRNRTVLQSRHARGPHDSHR